MSVAIERKAPWYTREYLRMTAAAYASGVLTVDFEDGQQAHIHFSDLRLDSTTIPNWQGMTVGTYEIVIPTDEGDIEIPWDVIRVLTDPAFEQHLATQAAEQAQRIGRRIQELRTQQGLDRRELATRAGVAVDRLERIERGGDGVSLPALERVLHALGGGWDDLASERPTT